MEARLITPLDRVCRYSGITVMRLHRSSQSANTLLSIMYYDCKGSPNLPTGVPTISALQCTCTCVLKSSIISASRGRILPPLVSCVARPDGHLFLRSADAHVICTSNQTDLQVRLSSLATYNASTAQSPAPCLVTTAMQTHNNAKELLLKQPQCLLLLSVHCVVHYRFTKPALHVQCSDLNM